MITENLEPGMLIASKYPRPFSKKEVYNLAIVLEAPEGDLVKVLRVDGEISLSFSYYWDFMLEK